MNDLQVAKGLGWFSLGLGLTEIAAPFWLGEKAGAPLSKRTMRRLGAREIAAGVGILAPKNPAPGLWARFAGDLMDLAVLGRSFKHSLYRNRLGIAVAAVLGVTALDFMYARRLQS